MEAPLRGDHLLRPLLDLLEVTELRRHPGDPGTKVGHNSDPMDPVVLEPMVTVDPNRRRAWAV